MKIPPYLPVSKLYEGMVARPSEPFFIQPKDYRVVDGDTIRVLAPSVDGGRRKEAFRIRLYSVNTPEKPKRRGSEAALERIGINMHEDSPGLQAKALVQSVCQGRALFIEPVKGDEDRITDKYGRLLAHIAISGSVGANFDTEGAYALAPFLVRRGFAHPLRNLDLPPDVPNLIWRLNQDQKQQHDFGGPSF
jgi:endonuclease YncB( thermonuclease family)